MNVPTVVVEGLVIESCSALVRVEIGRSSPRNLGEVRSPFIGVHFVHPLLGDSLHTATHATRRCPSVAV